MSDPFKTEEEKHNDRVIRDLALDRRLDRLCVIAAGVLHAGSSDRRMGEPYDHYVVRLSRAILAKLEEE